MQRATGDFLLVKRLLTHNIDTALEREMTSGDYVLTETDQLLEGMNKTVEYIFAAIGEPYPYKTTAAPTIRPKTKPLPNAALAD
jgi:hypothetical protein